MRRYSLIFPLLALGALFPPSDGMGMLLSNDKTQVVPIRLPAQADERIVEAAEDLSQSLETMFGKPFPIETQKSAEVVDSEKGIVLATLSDYPKLANRLKANQPGASEGFLIQSGADQVLLIGASPLGVQNAVWDFLYRLGYRHYFPGENWEIFPQLDKFDASFDVATQPVFATREIFIGYALLGEAEETWARWKKHNRLDYGFRLKTGHAYDDIVKRNREAFLAHPEYLAIPMRKEGRGDKFVVANEGLRELVVADALKQLEDNPELSSISMDPSDGGFWPESSPLGSVSNQVVTLANTVAVALREVAPGTKVGIYAYNEHSPAPTIRVDPDVIVSVATAFIQGGKPFEVQMQEWKKQADSLGVRDYLAVWTWDNDLPGKSRGSSPSGVAERMRKFRDLGARYYITESSYSSGPNGLGHFQASRSLWDPDGEQTVEEMREEFLSKAFGPSKAAMEEFYQLIDGANRPLLSDHLIGGMYRALQKAYAETGDGDEAVRNRLDDLAAYTHFVELYRAFDEAGESERQATFDDLTEFSARISDSGMVTTRGMLRDLPVRNKDVMLQEELKAAAKTSSSLGPVPSREELLSWVEEGSRKYPSLGFEPKAYSLDLVPLVKEPSFTDPSSESTLRLRGKNTLYTYLTQAGGSLEFVVEGDQLDREAGPVRISVFPKDHPFGESIFDIEVPADKARHTVRLKSKFSGLHRIEISDGGNMTFIHWPTRQTLAIPSGQEECAYIIGRYSLSFFVPKGIRKIGGYAPRPTGKVLGPDGIVRLDFSEHEGAAFFEIEVPEGDDDEVWKLDNCLDQVLLMTVPSFLSFDENGLLIPVESAETAERDSNDT